METITTIMNRRSVRKYLDRPVKSDLVEAVLIAGAQAPSGMNSQGREIVAFTDPALLAELNAAVMSSLPEETRARILSRTEEGKEPSFFYGAPVLIAVCDGKDAFRPVEDCACALENMFLAACDLGLGTCWINQLTGNDSPEIRAVLDKAGVSPDCKVYGCCALGYADGSLPPRLGTRNNKIIIK